MVKRRRNHFLVDAFLRGNILLGRVYSRDQILQIVRALKVEPTDFPLIRVGPETDGGYLVPDDLDGITGCISPGVADECRFDLDLAERGIDVYMADASVSGPPEDHPRFHFSPKFLDVFESSQATTIDAFWRSTGLTGDLLLQMDVEGAEYRILASMSSELLQSFRIMVIEFHNLNLLFTVSGQLMFAPIFQKLLQTHRVAHIHPNNAAPVYSARGIDIPALIEVTFHRRDRASPIARTATFPHPLDRACVETYQDHILPRIWW